MYTEWNDGKPVSIEVHAVDQNTKKTTKDSDVEKRNSNVKSVGERMTMQQHDHGTIPNILTQIALLITPSIGICFEVLGNSNVHQ